MGTLVCPNCASKNVININLAIEHDTRVSFYSCHRCERRWWHKDGQDAALPEVLALARRKPSKRV